MKAREAFEKIRNQRNNKLSLRFRMTLVISGEILLCVLFSYGISMLLNNLIKTPFPLIAEVIVISLLVGILANIFMSRWIFSPIKNMRKAMETVADGDFSVRLETRSSSKEIREMYSGFNLMAYELEKTDILQSDFVSNVSHEFKTPINAIEGYSTLLQDDGNLTDEQKEYVDKILFNTKRLSSLVGSILLLSKIENQSAPVSRTVYRLDEQIRQSILALEPEWSNKNIDFDVELDSIEYLGNESMMHHIWDNLIGNAVKFNPESGIVRLRLRRDERDIVFTVEDSGPGISEEEKKHIFNKFYQGDSSHSKEGNGLGLALVKKILTLSDGDVYVENIEGGGCRFTVVLHTAEKN